MWGAEWKGLSGVPGLAGSGRTPEVAIEDLVRAVRRAVLALPALKPDQAQALRLACEQVGVPLDP